MPAIIRQKVEAKNKITNASHEKQQSQQLHDATQKNRTKRSVTIPHSLESPNNDFENPCRRFVFAPKCRGVTSKRSGGLGNDGAPIPLTQSAQPVLQLNPEPFMLNESENWEVSN